MARTASRFLSAVVALAFVALLAACTSSDAGGTGGSAGAVSSAGSGGSGTGGSAGSGSQAGSAGAGGRGGSAGQALGGGGAAGQGASTGGQAGAAGQAGQAGSAGTVSGGAGAGGQAGATGGAGSGGKAGATGGAGSAGAGAGGQAGAGGAGGSTSNSPCPTNGEPCIVMPFGDSITDGYGVAGGYRIELFRLAAAGKKNITFVGSQKNGPAQVNGVDFPQQHEGHSGWTIDSEGWRTGISTLVKTVMPKYKPHIITLMIGTNDAIDDYDMTNAPKRLGNLIDAIYAQLPDVFIIVAQPIPSQDDALNGRIRTYDATIPGVVQQRASAGRRISIVNMYPVIGDQANFKTALLQDTWHPNEAGYKLMGAAWYQALAPLLP